MYFSFPTQERKLRKKIHNRLLEIQGNIRVLCRIRPILEVERRSGEDVDITEVPNEEELYVQRDQQVCMLALLGCYYCVCALGLKYSLVHTFLNHFVFLCFQIESHPVRVRPRVPPALHPRGGVRGGAAPLRVRIR